uniref:Uncharacterized protein n=1 Tax=Nelumbo nucifera TaxID=4432 RepID=A0A822XXB2_NELNU|nr:TPA_asm: hypothetical protein HUJ06_025817 [Nelumbo nucifera]
MQGTTYHVRPSVEKNFYSPKISDPCLTTAPLQFEPGKRQKPTRGGRPCCRFFLWDPLRSPLRDKLVNLMTSASASASASPGALMIQLPNTH